MISWLISQQLLVCCVLSALILLERYAVKYLGTRTSYAIWALLPLALLANNLPKQIIPVQNNQIVEYLVLFNQQAQATDWSPNWIFLWSLGALSVISYVIVSQFSLLQRINKAYAGPLPLCLPNRLQVYSCADIKGPVLTGIISPKLLLPTEFTTRFSPTQQSLMLQHELVHYQRKDIWFNLLAILLVAVFWFNPLSWLSYGAFRRTQELSCDEAVLRTSSLQQKLCYGKALVQCAEKATGQFAIYSPYGEKHTMITRLKLIQHAPKNRPGITAMVLLLGTALLSSVALANMANKTQVEDKAFLAAPITRVEPVYPNEAASQGLEGSVVLQFDIEADGSTSNIRVIDAQPAYTFDDSAINALAAWTYKPRIMGGQALKQTGLKVQLDFKLGE
ncbi:M56 family metallopeptidase [Aliiglaciecola sp. LCG003]|uniref:M56 family metallopeptidase n=1 Tax=Aliiglaciecola sp. LCG003 TaxID=3053655 RepID=UPI002572B6DF|nr:M56 family metallopeptidase [Aliiglaciecola sp. LCG003]WJG10717.1 M56 family metallopeptidase [Aliiglaciecola sp. LCG003]